jgi:hypothetical protein
MLSGRRPLNLFKLRFVIEINLAHSERLGNENTTNDWRNDCNVEGYSKEPQWARDSEE